MLTRDLTAGHTGSAPAEAAITCSSSDQDALGRSRHSETLHSRCGTLFVQITITQEQCFYDVVDKKGGSAARAAKDDAKAADMSGLRIPSAAATVGLCGNCMLCCSSSARTAKHKYSC